MEKNMKRLYDLLSNSTIFVMFTVAVYFVATTNGPAYAAMIEEQVAVQEMQKKVEAYSVATDLGNCELFEVLSIAGFEGQSLKKAWAVSKTESNGRPLAHNGNRKTGDNSYGIFQVNMIDNLGDVRRDKYGLTSNSNLYNPILNAEVVYRMSNSGKDWSSWPSYGTVRYKEFVKEFPDECLTMLKNRDSKLKHN